MSCVFEGCPPLPPSAASPADLPTTATTVNCFQVTLYYNTQQQYTNSCSGGSSTPPITVTVLANTFLSSVSQEDANAQAYAAAITQADALRALSPCSAPVNLLLAEDNSTFIVLEDGVTFIAL